MKKILIPCTILLLLFSSCTKSGSKKKPDPTPSETSSVTIYAMNDYHGMVNGYMPIEKLGSFIKEKTSEPNVLFLDQGDAMQGTLDSNYNRGRMITDVFNASHVSARTVGNHDFDWGVNVIKNNNTAEYKGYKTPYLAANVYDFDDETKTEGTTQQESIGKEYAVVTCNNGLKVGIVGVIGKENITVITTDRVKDLCFKDPVETIKRVSDKLRTVEKCDIVIASCHTSQNTLLETGITAVSEVSGKRYVDLVLCGHTHKDESTMENGVLFAQYRSNGSIIGRIKLDYDLTAKEASLLSNDSVSSYELSSQTVNQEIQSIVTSYKTHSAIVGSEVLTTKLNGNFSRYGAGSNFVARSIFETVKNQGYEVSYTIINNNRTDFSGTTLTYADLYEAIPFDNLVYILDCKGSDIARVLRPQYSNYMYRNSAVTDGYNALVTTKTYRVAVIDYLAFHVNETRNPIYFMDCSVVAQIKKSGNEYTYCDMTADYIRSFGEEQINSSNYSSYDKAYDVERLTESF